MKRVLVLLWHEKTGTFGTLCRKYIGNNLIIIYAALLRGLYGKESHTKIQCNYIYIIYMVNVTRCLNEGVIYLYKNCIS